MDDSSARSRFSSWRPNEGEIACFKFAADRSLWIRNGSIECEPADGVIVPTNTELIVSGAADAVLRTVEMRLCEGDAQRDIFDALFGISVPNAPKRNAGSVFIDDVVRSPVGELGGAAISVSLSSLNIELLQGWDRVIVAFVRSQSRPSDFQDTLTESTVRSSVQTALRAATDCGMRSVATVPFGTGLNNITAEDSASYMIPAIVDFLNSDASGCLKKVTIVEQCIGRFEAFARVTKMHFSVGRFVLE